MRLATRTLVVAVLLAVASACGGGGDDAVAPARVPADLVPDRLLGDSLGTFENRDPSTLRALENAGPASLVADSRVWEIRRGDRLVATLQISTVEPAVDLLDESIRERFAGQLIAGQVNRFRSGDVEVFSSTVNDKTIFLWFGANLYEIMQTKDRVLDPEALLEDVLEHQSQSESWQPLPELVDFDD